MAAPQVSLVSPTDGSVSAGTPVVIDVTDADADIVAVFIWVHYADTGDTEVVWTGDGFAPRYAASTREAVSDGHRYALLRAGGWRQPPDVRVRAFDANGGEA